MLYFAGENRTPIREHKSKIVDFGYSYQPALIVDAVGKRRKQGVEMEWDNETENVDPEQPFTWVGLKQADSCGEKMSVQDEDSFEPQENASKEVGDEAFAASDVLHEEWREDRMPIESYPSPTEPLPEIDFHEEPMLRTSAVSDPQSTENEQAWAGTYLKFYMWKMGFFNTLLFIHSLLRPATGGTSV